MVKEIRVYHKEHQMPDIFKNAEVIYGGDHGWDKFWITEYYVGSYDKDPRNGDSIRVITYFSDQVYKIEQII